MNIVHFDTSRLTPLGWALNILSWASLVGLFVAGPAGAPKSVVITCVCVFFGSLLVAKILDYAGNAIHVPRARKVPLESRADGASNGREQR